MGQTKKVKMSNPQEMIARVNRLKKEVKMPSLEDVLANMQKLKGKRRYEENLEKMYQQVKKRCPGLRKEDFREQIRLSGY